MEHSAVLIWLPLAGFVALLGLAALIDLRERRIPNWLTGGVAALYPAYVLVSPTPVAWPGSLALAAAVFLFGLVMFARQLIGGGDVKLIAATTLWAGLDNLALFAIVTSLAGGGLALGGLWYRRWQGVIDAHLAALGLKLASAGRAEHAANASLGGSDRLTSISTEPTPLTLPYGIAIAAGGLAVVVQLTKF
ncbi:MAG TPA: prepilin peptidase [Geminicoccaceae bacterium]|nr:prepilin peptidase [Geminicoccaceae bacterium]